MNHLFRSLFSSAAYFLAAEVVVGGEKGKRKLYSIVTSCLILGAGALLLYVSILFAALTLFFYLAGFTELVRPAWVVAAVLLVVSLILFWEGKRRWSR